MLAENSLGKASKREILGNVNATAREVYKILPMYYKNIANAINFLFDDNELRSLCFYLSIEYEDLTGNHKEEKIVALVNTCISKNIVRELVINIKNQRPTADIETAGLYADLELPETFTQSEHSFSENFLRNFFDVFNTNELRSMVFAFGIDWDGLPGEAKSDKAISFLSVVVRKNRVEELLSYLNQQRPKTNWNV